MKKKVLALTMAALMAASLTACGGGAKETTAADTTAAQRYKQVHRSKAKIHTFLAWQDEPGKPIGQAITARILNPDAEEAKAFIGWLNKLYDR